MLAWKLAATWVAVKMTGPTAPQQVDTRKTRTRQALSSRAHARLEADLTLQIPASSMAPSMVPSMAQSLQGPPKPWRMLMPSRQTSNGDLRMHLLNATASSDKNRG